VKYGFGVLGTAMSLRLKRWGLAKPAFLADLPYERLLSDNMAPIRSRLASADSPSASEHSLGKLLP
jgi:hypothetical protein